MHGNQEAKTMVRKQRKGNHSEAVEPESETPQGKLRGRIGFADGKSVQEEPAELAKRLESLLAQANAGAGEICPPDQRLQSFLERHFGPGLVLPQAISLYQHGLARALSLPETGDAYSSAL